MNGTTYEKVLRKRVPKEPEKGMILDHRQAETLAKKPETITVYQVYPLNIHSAGLVRLTFGNSSTSEEATTKVDLLNRSSSGD